MILAMLQHWARKSNTSLSALAGGEKISLSVGGRKLFFVLSMCIHKAFIIRLYSTLVVLFGKGPL